MNPGDRLGPYTVVEPLGAGGMGEVYRAHDARLAREVALKRLSDGSLGSDVARQRILREARAAASLSHPNIATIYDVLDTPDGLVIVMEYVRGETLASRLRRGPLALDEALMYAAQIAEALTDAHEHGIIHRDLKPANIHLTPEGKAKILDFGIARSIGDAADPAAGDGATLTGASQIVGTPGYMAPEQLAGGRGDQRTDIYGLGLLLYEMLSGQRPFNKSDFVGNALAVFEGRAPQVRAVAPHVPQEVSDLVARAMARDPDDRFPTARAVSAVLRDAVRGLSNAETSILPSSASYRPRTRRPRVAAGAALLAAALVAALLWVQPWKTSTPTPAPASARSSVIGVLPFSNRSGDATNDSLAAGLTDAVAARLASVRSLRVLPLDETREAMRATPAVGPLARTLGAAFVVEGGLQRTGDTLEVHVALIGEDGRRRPAVRYPGDVARLFDLHRRVAEGLTAALSQEGALRAESQPQAAPPTANEAAFAEYAQARVFLERPDVAGSLDHAITLLLSAIAKDKGFAIAYAGLGEAYWAQYRETKDPAWTVKAFAANLEALRLDPAQPEVRFALAVMYQGSDRADEAMEELRKVLAMQPRNDNAHLVLGRILEDKGDWDRAVAEAQAAITLRPTYWRNHAQLGDTLFRAGRLTEAMTAYTRLIELQPDSPRGYQRLGRALQAAGNIDRALENYEKATAIRPSGATYSNMGTSYYWRGDYARAVDAYQRAIALAPNDADLHANLGDARLKLGRRDGAVESYRRAVTEVRKLLAVKENDPLNLAALALYQAKLGERAPAAASIARAAALSPQDGEVLYVGAVVHALAGRTGAACNAAAAALAHGKSAVEVRYSDELKSLKGCPAYDRLPAAVR